MCVFIIIIIFYHHKNIFHNIGVEIKVRSNANFKIQVAVTMFVKSERNLNLKKDF